MIIYDLKCENEHTFEGWFKDRKAFDEQKEEKLINCPICGSREAEMVPSSLTVMGRDSRAVSSDRAPVTELSPRKALQLLNEYVETHFQDVGDEFAEVAVRIHNGEEEERNIRGTTTKVEEELLREEGIQYFKIPVAKYDS